MDDSMVRKDAAVYDSVRGTLVAARKKAAAAVNDAMVEAYWEVGRQIVEAQGDRAEYGKHLMEYLSERLTKEFGRGYDKRNLHYMKQFYLAFPIVNTLCSQLSWSHYRLLMRVEDEKKRLFYMREALDQHWTVRQLDREVIDLKTGKITPQDVGQMDFYVRLFDDRCVQPDDNPTIGIILCATKDATVARYSALADDKGLFASRYTLCLPTEEEIAQALEPTSALFLE